LEQIQQTAICTGSEDDSISFMQVVKVHLFFDGLRLRQLVTSCF